MEFRRRVLLVMGMAALTGCGSDSGFSPLDEGPITLQRVAPSFTRIEPFDTLVFAATRGGTTVKSQDLDWSTTNPEVLRLLASGRFVAGSTGKATVRATSPDGASASATVEVSPAMASSLHIPSELSLVVTETVQLDVVVLDRKGNPVLGGVEDQLVLTSRDPDVVSVGPDLSIRGVSTGTTQISVRLGELEAETAVQVHELPRLQLDSNSVRLRRTGNWTVVGGMVKNKPTTIESLRIVDEDRWLDGEPVVDVRGDTVVARVPGLARIEASVSLALPDTLSVRVEPDGPTVYLGPPLQPLSEAVPLTFRGWELDSPTISGVTIGGATAPIIFQDSATLRVRLPDQPDTGCSGDARRHTVVAGADYLPRDYILVARAGEVTAQPGEALAPPPGACLKLPADAAARWALAVTDGDVWSAVGQVAPFSGGGPTTELTLSDQTGTADALSTEAPREREGSSARGPVLADAEAFQASSAIDRPYELGDTATISDWGLFRVQAIVRDRYVLFLNEGSPVEDILPTLTAVVDTMDATVRPLLDPMVSAPPQNEFGQYTISIKWDPGHGYFGISSPSGFVIRVSDKGGEPMHEVFIHEYAHSYQYRVQSDDIEGGGRGGAYVHWSWEGLAVFTQREVRRRVHGIPLDANVSLDAPGLEWLTEEAKNQGGEILWGYDNSAGFFRHLVKLWRETTGVSDDQAFRQVFAGSVLGWWDCDYQGECSYQGLARRFADVLGRTVDPSNLLLDWALSQAADDRVSTSRWRNTLFTLASGSRDHLIDPVQANQGWTPLAALEAGEGDVSFDMPEGGIEWIAIGDLDGRGATLRLPDDPRWRWKLLRIR